MVSDSSGLTAGSASGGQLWQRQVLGEDQRPGRPCRVQVVIQQAPDGILAIAGRLGAGSLLARVRAEQVVKRVPAGDVLGDQARPGELGEQPLRLGRGQAGQAARGRRREVRAWMQAEEAE